MSAICNKQNGIRKAPWHVGKAEQVFKDLSYCTALSHQNKIIEFRHNLQFCSCIVFFVFIFCRCLKNYYNYGLGQKCMSLKKCVTIKLFFICEVLSKMQEATVFHIIVLLGVPYASLAIHAFFFKIHVCFLEWFCL